MLHKNIFLTFFVSLSINLTSQNTPGDNFDLSAWKLQTLKETDSSYTEIKPIENHTNIFFYTDDDSNGAMVFKVPSNGGKTSPNTSYPRVELRQFYGDYNWALSDTNEHYLTAECSVNEVYEGKPKTTIGQIHGKESNSELLKIRWTGYKDGDCFIEARFQNNDHIGAEYGITLASGLSLGDIVTYTITMIEGLVTVTINGNTASQLYTSEFYGTTDTYYFKAGNYIQWNQDIIGNETVISGINKFYKLSLKKETLTNTNLDIKNNFKAYPNPAKEYILLETNSVNTSGVKVNIIDNKGRLVKKTILTNVNLIYNNTYQVNLNDLKPGIYFLQITSNEKLETKKLIIR